MNKRFPTIICKLAPPFKLAHWGLASCDDQDSTVYSECCLVAGEREGAPAQVGAARTEQEWKCGTAPHISQSYLCYCYHVPADHPALHHCLPLTWPKLSSSHCPPAVVRNISSIVQSEVRSARNVSFDLNILNLIRQWWAGLGWQGQGEGIPIQSPLSLYIYIFVPSRRLDTEVITVWVPD